MSHTSFAATTCGLNPDLPPIRLYEKTKKLGIWNPSGIDFSKNKQDWATFKEDEKDLIWPFLALFVAGEEAVTVDLLPLIEVIVRAGCLEEEMFPTTFLFDEARHTDFFGKFSDEVAVSPLL